MDRRKILTHTLAAGAVGLSAAAISSKAGAQESSKAEPFKLKYAPHFGMFKHSAGNDPIDQIKFMADQGFPALEDNGMMGRDVALQSKIGDTLKSLNMTMGVFVVKRAGGADGMMSKTDKQLKSDLKKSCEKAVETAKRCGATWMTVVPGKTNQKIPYDYQMANLVDNLKTMAEVFEPHGLVMVLEALNWYSNHPGLFLQTIPQGYSICKSVNSPACKILDDLYHQQISEGNLIPNMEKAWSEIGYIQVGDNPRRKEPTTGEINYKNIFKWLRKKGYKGVVGMEHGNSIKGIEGEKAVIKAYREVDNF